MTRIFIVEVMGRKRGFLALTIGLTVGAEVILVPEVEYQFRAIIRTLETNGAKGKKSGIIVAAEGIGDTHKLMREIEKEAGVEVRLSVTGYAQRGGNPTARSRLLANLFGNKAVQLATEPTGKHDDLPRKRKSSQHRPQTSMQQRKTVRPQFDDAGTNTSNIKVPRIKVVKKQCCDINRRKVSWYSPKFYETKTVYSKN